MSNKETEEDVKQPEIIGELTKLDESIENAMYLIFDRLLPKLHPILNGAVTDEESKPTEPATDIGKSINNKRIRIDRINGEIENILNTIEI